MHHSHRSPSIHHAVLPLERFETLQERYQSLKLRERACRMLADAKPALDAAEEVLRALAQRPKIRSLISDLRKNTRVIQKMRPSEARNMLMDPHMDFIDVTRRKLQAWRKTMQRLADGEGIISAKDMEYIPRHLPVAGAYACISEVSGYLSIVQLLLMELEMKDNKHSESYRFSIARIRRCSTVLSDCQNAADIATHIH
ncbi:MAG: hypothetical protein AB7L92_06085 [Alphaproteobacteria bacterium]